MKVSYILTVCDYEVCGFFMKTVATYRSNSLPYIRKIEGRLAKKARKNPDHRVNVSKWGSEVHNGPTLNPVRTLNIKVMVR